VWQNPLAFSASAVLGLAASFMTFLVIKVSETYIGAPIWFFF
jgi:hypothetical protein